MLKLKIFSIGKTKEAWLEAAIAEYTKRLQSTVLIEFIWARDNQHLVDLAKKEPMLICLDPTGRLMASEPFSAFIIQCWEKGGSRLAIVIGGAEGLPSELKNAALLVSLSPLTFTHQLTRLILIEQIYRTLEIQKGSHYHK